MKKFLALLMTFMMVVAVIGCSNKNDSDSKDKPTEAPAVTATPDITEAPKVTDAPEITDAPEVTEAPEITDIPEITDTPEIPEASAKVQPIAISIETTLDDFGDNSAFYKDVYVARTSYELPYISEEDAVKYPAAAEGLRAVREFITQTAANDLATMYELACSDLDEGREFEEPFYSDVHVKVMRSDSSIISLLFSNNSWYGGPHPNYYFSSINIDVATGQYVNLSDVLSAACFENGCELIVSDIVESIDVSDDEVFGFDTLYSGIADGSIVWTMDYQGIAFHINPYDIASYAAGSFTANLSFKKYPEIFSGLYVETPDRYMIDADHGYVTFDFDGDGLYEAVSADLIINEDFYSSETLITIYDPAAEDYVQYIVPVTDLGDEGSTDMVLLHNSDGRNYLYHTVITDNDLSQLWIYEISKTGISTFGGKLMYFKPVNPELYRYLSYTVPDPDDMLIVTRNDLFGTTFESASYTVGKNGEIIMLDEYYYFTFNPEIITREDMEFILLDSDTNAEIGTETLPAGTAFSMIRGDGEGAIDFEVAGGQLYRIRLDKTVYDDCFVYFGYINDVPIYELFDGISYAG